MADGRLLAVGSRDEILAMSHDHVIDVGDRLVTPGLVDAHAHPVFAGNRALEFERRCSGATYEEIAASGGGIRSTVAATRAATEEELFRCGQRFARWFLASGTTTLEAKSGYGLTIADELKILRVIRRLNQEAPLEYVPTLLGAHAVPHEFGGSAEFAQHVIDEMIPQVAAEGLAEYVDAFCEMGYFDVETTWAVLTAGREHGLGIRLHADQLSCGGGAELAAELGAVTADHLEQTGTPGIMALAKAGVQPVLLPGSVYALGKHKYPAAREMNAAGLAVVLATDFNPGSSPVPSLPMVMSLACTQMEMTPHEALTATTINAAYSLGRGHDRGSLEPGKRADFVVFDADDPREIPYWVGADLVCETWIGGAKVWSR
jgi:imidazolonepropionase